MKISISGKGGSGKSTVATLLAKQALQRGRTVLVVDADDSNSGLYRMLGFEHPPTPLMALVGGKDKIKEKMGQSTLLTQAQISITDIHPEFIVRRDGLMMVAIGKILHSLEGCACPMGVLNREFLNKLTLNDHELAIIDMEAGIEHFGRGIDEAIDQVLVVIEPSFDSLVMAEKINDLAGSIGKKVAVVLNKIPSEKISLEMEAEVASKGMELIGILPYDSKVFDANLHGKTAAGSQASEAAGRIVKQILQV